MPADRAILEHRDPHGLRERAPVLSSGLPAVVATGGQTEHIPAPSTGALISNAPAAAFAGAFLGCLATLHFIAAGFVPAIASALATILLCGPLLITRTTSLFPGESFTAIYGGTFAGMTPLLALSDHVAAVSVIPASALFVLLSIVSGLAFCLVAEIDARSGRRLAAGCGGRSGAIATVASLLFVEAALLLGADGQVFRAAHAHIVDLEPRALALSCAAGMSGIAATMAVLRQRRIAFAEPAARICVAAMVALVGLMIVHLVDPGDPCMMDAFYAGCFLGMSTPERLRGWVQPVSGAVLLTAMLVVVKTLLPDVGGELGFAAFVTAAILLAVRRVTTEPAPTSPTRGRQQPGTVSKVSVRASASGHLIAGMPVRRTIGVVGSLAGLLLMGWLALPAEVSSEEPAGDTVAPARVAEQPAPLHEQSALVETPGTVDVAISLDLPHDVPSDVTLDLPPGAVSAVAVNADPGDVLRRSVDSTPAVTETAQGVVADARAELVRGGRAEGVTPANHEPAQVGSPVDGLTKSHEALFREFIRWRDARSGAIAHPQPQPVKRIRNPVLQMVRLTPPAAIRTAPRAPTRTPAIRHVPGQSVP